MIINTCGMIQQKFHQFGMGIQFQRLYRSIILTQDLFSGFRVTRSLVFCVMSWRSLFIPLSFFFWPLCCLSFFYLRLLIASLVSSGFRYIFLRSFAFHSFFYMHTFAFFDIFTSPTHNVHTQP